jgi:hypothetical protein
MTDNRWAAPRIDDVSYPVSELPKAIDGDRVAEALRDLVPHPAHPTFLVLGREPMLHVVDDGDGTPSMWFWRACCILVQPAEDGVHHGLRFTSCAMHEPGDLAEEVGREFTRRVVAFIASSTNTEVQDV